jgi:uncharacterized membrane protein
MAEERSTLNIAQHGSVGISCGNLLTMTFICFLMAFVMFAFLVIFAFAS